jgi:hypothetical protein
MKMIGIKSFFFKKSRPSNGVFALIFTYITCLIYSNIDYHIQIRGINPKSKGHNYQKTWLKRGHTNIDKQIITKMVLLPNISAEIYN